MATLILIGLVGGLITGISPCVLPVLPVLFLSGAAAEANENVRPSRARPFLIVAGLAISFSLFTLLGTVLLRALPIPDDTIRWAGLVALVLIGLAMLFPRLQDLLERPFRRIHTGPVGRSHHGLLLGFALGAVYVPCAGPVLAAITVAGATGEIGLRTAALTIAFAIGTAAPLLVFALAGSRVAERVRTFRSRQRRVRIAAGFVLIGLAVALTFNATDALQRAVPDYAAAANRTLNDAGVKALGSRQDDELSRCVDTHSDQLVDCGPAPPIAGIGKWLNSADGSSVSITGKVALVDFWAYSCINCQRAIPHVEAWARSYQSAGLTVIGVHTPEYAFEHDPDNIAAGAKRLGITYPVAVDNDYVSWKNFHNKAWPATFLIDATGRVRHVSVGEGNYDRTESLIRQMLLLANPKAHLPPATETPNFTPSNPLQTPETFLGTLRQSMFVGRTLTDGTFNFTYPETALINTFALTGTWTIGGEALTAGADAGIELRYVSAVVYLDVGGKGTLVITDQDSTTPEGSLPRSAIVAGAPNIYTVASAAEPHPGHLRITVSPGLQLYSFSYG